MKHIDQFVSVPKFGFMVVFLDLSSTSTVSEVRLMLSSLGMSFRTNAADFEDAAFVASSCYVLCVGKRAEFLY